MIPVPKPKSIPPLPKNKLLKLITEDMWDLYRLTKPCVSYEGMRWCVRAEQLKLRLDKPSGTIVLTWRF